MQKPRVLSGSYTAWARESGPTQKKPFAGIAGAAKQRNPQAMFNLGVSYYNGDGVSADPTLAYAWFLLAQEAGNAAAGDAVKRSAAEGERLGVTSDALQQVAEMY